MAAGDLYRDVILRRPAAGVPHPRVIRLSRPAVPPAPALALRSVFDDSGGIGVFAVGLARALARHSPLPVELYPINQTWHQPPPADVQEMMRGGNSHWHPWELLFDSVCFGEPSVARDKHTVLFTMWETDRLPASAVPAINRAAVCVVPCAWCAEVFRDSGVTVPIRVVQLGIDTRLFRQRPQLFWGNFVFGTASFGLPGGRKYYERVIEAFRQEFKSNEPVELWMKVRSAPDIDTGDPRVIWHREWFDVEGLVDWYCGINVFVSAAASEGWGLHQQQAMCVGRPVIGVNYGGVREFWSPANGYEVAYTVGPGDGIYAGHGNYAHVSVTSIRAAMRRAYVDRQTLLAKGDLAAAAAALLTLDRSALALLAVLREFGCITAAATLQNRSRDATFLPAF
ncbi:MAG: glycosyltransferase family protein [Limisphaerales bacterium]